MKYEITVVAEVDEADLVDVLRTMANIASVVREEGVEIKTVTHKAAHSYQGQTPIHRGPNVTTWNAAETIGGGGKGC